MLEIFRKAKSETFFDTRLQKLQNRGGKRQKNLDTPTYQY